ncbi:MAG: 50S ribosomal protein L17 [bacterium]
MRHRDTRKKFGRVAGPRAAMIRSLATSLILTEKITTTEAKAKAVRPLVERLVTRGKENILVTRRYIMSHLQSEKAVLKVLNELGVRYKARKGGYLRVTKLLPRKGDGAKLARVEFV